MHLLLLVNIICQVHSAVCDEVVRRHGGVVPDGESHLVGVPQQVCGEGLVPHGLLGLAFGAGALDRHFVHVDRHVRVQEHVFLRALA